MSFSPALFFNDQITLYLANKSNSSHFFQRIRVPLYTAILDIQVAGADAVYQTQKVDTKIFIS